MKLAERFEAIVAILARAGIAEARLEAALLLSHFLGLSRTELVLHRDDDFQEPAGLAAAVARRAAREPLAYILGEVAFYDVTLQVSPAVLVPRPETELLVERVLDLVPPDVPARWLDVGTGSGAIGIVLARQRPRATVIGIDRSRAALEVAAANCRRTGASLRLIAADTRRFPFADGVFDGLAANLPYVPSAEIDNLEPEVRCFEPRQALDGGRRGVELYLAALAEFRRVLRPGGWLIFEIGADQGDFFRKYFRPETGFGPAEIVADYAGLSRLVVTRSTVGEAAPARSR